jgi:hypothetical protein
MNDRTHTRRDFLERLGASTLLATMPVTPDVLVALDARAASGPTASALA